MIEIREATAAHRDAAIAVWHACGLTRPWNDPSRDFARALAFPGSIVLIAERDAEPVGTAMAGFDGHRGWVYYLGVVPAHRRQGIARELLRACERWLADRGCPKAELMVREGNPDAQVYERLGWEAQPVRVYAHWLDKKDS